jgi:hypothetical protein
MVDLACSSIEKQEELHKFEAFSYLINLSESDFKKKEEFYPILIEPLKKRNIPNKIIEILSSENIR